MNDDDAVIVIRPSDMEKCAGFGKKIYSKLLKDMILTSVKSIFWGKRKVKSECVYLNNFFKPNK
jgi:hypothetical protein